VLIMPMLVFFYVYINLFMCVSMYSIIIVLHFVVINEDDDDDGDSGDIYTTIRYEWEDLTFA